MFSFFKLPSGFDNQLRRFFFNWVQLWTRLFGNWSSKISDSISVRWQKYATFRKTNVKLSGSSLSQFFNIDFALFFKEVQWSAKHWPWTRLFSKFNWWFLKNFEKNPKTGQCLAGQCFADYCTGNFWAKNLSWKFTSKTIFFQKFGFVVIIG